MNAIRRKQKECESLSLPLVTDDLPEPASAISRRGIAAPAKPRSSKNKPKKAAANPQAFLPGMSRRGRPRAKVAVAASERAANSRRRRIAAGAKRVELMLDAAVLGQLDALAAHLGETRSGVVVRLLARAPARLLK
jgi:hypothetical protein